jgi:hypothetical protein
MALSAFCLAFTTHGESKAFPITRAASPPTTTAAAPATKYAMLVGVNKYPGNALNGCVNDVTNLREMLVKNFGFAPDNIVVLTDEQATRENILAKLDSFASRLHRDDLFVFAYSGHGTLFPDSYSEEQDETETLHFAPDPRNHDQPFFADGKYDAAICPVDSRETSSGKPWHNLILDDELYSRFSKFAGQGATINYLTDSCFSGTQGRDLFKTRSMKLSDAIGVPVDQIQKPAATHRAAARDMGGKYLVLSSSNSLQPSSEWRDDKGQPCGLFSYVLQKLVSLKDGKITYQELYDNSEYVVQKLSNSNQDPQMDTRFYSGSLDVQIFDLPRSAASASTASTSASATTPTASATPATTSSSGSSATASSASSPTTHAPSTASTTATPSSTSTSGSSSASSTTAPASSAPLKVLLLVMDAKGALLGNCSFAIFKPGITPVKGSIKREDILLLGRTNESGRFDSVSNNQTIAPGTYPIKIVREGYQTFQSTLVVKQGAKAGYAILAFRLNAE